MSVPIYIRPASTTGGISEAEAQEIATQTVTQSAVLLTGNSTKNGNLNENGDLVVQPTTDGIPFEVNQSNGNNMINVDSLNNIVNINASQTHFNNDVLLLGVTTFANTTNVTSGVFQVYDNEWPGYPYFSVGPGLSGNPVSVAFKSHNDDAVNVQMTDQNNVNIFSVSLPDSGGLNLGANGAVTIGGVEITVSNGDASGTFTSSQLHDALSGAGSGLPLTGGTLQGPSPNKAIFTVNDSQSNNIMVVSDVQDFDGYQQNSVVINAPLTLNPSDGNLNAINVSSDLFGVDWNGNVQANTLNIVPTTDGNALNINNSGGSNVINVNTSTNTTTVSNLAVTSGNEIQLGAVNIESTTSGLLGSITDVQLYNVITSGGSGGGGDYLPLSGGTIQPGTDGSALSVVNAANSATVLGVNTSSQMVNSTGLTVQPTSDSNYSLVVNLSNGTNLFGVGTAPSTNPPLNFINISGTQLRLTGYIGNGYDMFDHQLYNKVTDQGYYVSNGSNTTNILVTDQSKTFVAMTYNQTFQLPLISTISTASVGWRITILNFMPDNSSGGCTILPTGSDRFYSTVSTSATQATIPYTGWSAEFIAIQALSWRPNAFWYVRYFTDTPSNP